MLTESHKFVTAHFTNNERTTIEVEWQDPESDAIEIEYVEFNEEDASYQHLLQYIELDTLHDNTKIRVKEQRKTYLETVRYIAQEEGLIFNENTKGMFDRINDYLFTDNFDPEKEKEMLFNIKLSAFEQEMVKSTSRELKSKLRKAETIYEVYKVLFEIKES
jgi:hypothetical protein